MRAEQIMVIIGLILIGLELMAGVQTGFDLVLLGTILFVSGLAGFVGGGIYLSLALATILSAIYIAFGRQFVQSKLIVATKHTNIDKLMGKKGVVIRTITPDTAGMIRVEDEDWRAVSNEVIYEKEKAEVGAVEGVSLKVKKVSK
jgi:membrane protein implicated in regulation of membrane protease activity